MSRSIFDSKIFKCFIAVLCCVTLMIPSQLLVCSKAIADENAVIEESSEAEEIVVEDENFDATEAEENSAEEEAGDSTNTATHSVALKTIDASMGLIEDETGATFDYINFDVYDHSPYTYDPYTGVMTYVNTEGVTKTFTPHPNDGYDFQIWADRHGDSPAEEQGFVDSNLAYRAYFINNAPI